MRGAAAPVLAVLLVAVATAPAAAAPGPEDLGDPPPAALAASMRAWEPAGSVRAWDVSGSVRELGEVETDGETTTITLATDILFTPDSAEGAGSGAGRIAQLVTEVPDDATVQVRGHTDSRPPQVGNSRSMSSARTPSPRSCGAPGPT